MPQNITFMGRTSKLKRRDFYQQKWVLPFLQHSSRMEKSNRVMYQPALPLLPHENLWNSTTQGQLCSLTAKSWENELSSLHLWWNLKASWLNELRVLRRNNVTEFNSGNQYKYIIHFMSSWRSGDFWTSNFSTMTHNTLILICTCIPSQGNIFKAYITTLYQFPQHTKFPLTHPSGTIKPSPWKQHGMRHSQSSHLLYNTSIT